MPEFTSYRDESDSFGNSRRISLYTFSVLLFHEFRRIKRASHKLQNKMAMGLRAANRRSKSVPVHPLRI